MWKKDNRVICDNMHGPWAYYAKWSKSDTKTREISVTYNCYIKLSKIKLMKKKKRIKWYLPVDGGWLGDKTGAVKGRSLQEVINKSSKSDADILNMDNIILKLHITHCYNDNHM